MGIDNLRTSLIAREDCGLDVVFFLLISKFCFWTIDEVGSSLLSQFASQKQYRQKKKKRNFVIRYSDEEDKESSMKLDRTRRACAIV